MSQNNNANTTNNNININNQNNNLNGLNYFNRNPGEIEYTPELIQEFKDYLKTTAFRDYYQYPAFHKIENNEPLTEENLRQAQSLLNFIRDGFNKWYQEMAQKAGLTIEGSRKMNVNQNNNKSVKQNKKRKIRGDVLYVLKGTLKGVGNPRLYDPKKNQVFSLNEKSLKYLRDKTTYKIYLGGVVESESMCKKKFKVNADLSKVKSLCKSKIPIKFLRMIQKVFCDNEPFEKCDRVALQSGLKGDKKNVLTKGDDMRNFNNYMKTCDRGSKNTQKKTKKIKKTTKKKKKNSKRRKNKKK